jgi:hypothetical protein
MNSPACLYFRDEIGQCLLLLPFQRRAGFSFFFVVLRAVVLSLALRALGEVFAKRYLKGCPEYVAQVTCSNVTKTTRFVHDT